MLCALLPIELNVRTYCIILLYILYITVYYCIILYISSDDAFKKSAIKLWKSLKLMATTKTLSATKKKWKINLTSILKKHNVLKQKKPKILNLVKQVKFIF